MEEIYVDLTTKNVRKRVKRFKGTEVQRLKGIEVQRDKGSRVAAAFPHLRISASTHSCFCLLTSNFPSLLYHHGLDVDKLAYAIRTQLAPPPALLDSAKWHSRIAFYEIVDVTRAGF